MGSRGLGGADANPLEGLGLRCAPLTCPDASEVGRGTKWREQLSGAQCRRLGRTCSGVSRGVVSTKDKDKEQE